MLTCALRSSSRETATNSRRIHRAGASIRIVLKTNVSRCLVLASRCIVPALAIVGVVLLGSQSARSQTVTFSPVNLSFGVPTGTTAVAPDPYPASAPESVTVNIFGASTSTPVSFGATTVTGSNLSDFIVSGDSCTGQTFTAAAFCQVAVYFNASKEPSTTLETATLTITPSTGNLVVPLSGAYGSIKLFGETNVATPPGSTSFTNLYTIATDTLNLSCPASPTAALSGTPDGLGNVLVDNYLTLATGSFGSSLTPVTGIESNNPPGNLCSGTGATSNSQGDNPYFNCFTEAYESAALFNYPESIVGLDPDTFANSPNSVLASGDAGGIPFIPVSSFFTSGAQQDLFTLLSSGSATENYYANSTLFLATSCSPGGLVPGGTVTGNPTPVNNPCFDSNTGANLCLEDNSGQNPPPQGTTPVYTQIAVPQQLFEQLVAGTSAAVDVCFRSSAELDYSVAPPAPMCVGIEEQCWNPAHTTLSGANCDPLTPSQLRDLYSSFLFDSPDAPLNQSNYLYNSSPNACSYYLTGGFAGGGINNGACANNTGPSVLMGADAWLCAPGSSGSSCTPLEPNMLTAPIFNTQTPPTTTIYSSSQSTNCALTGDLAGDPCPLNILTQFLGETDVGPGDTKAAGNSVYIPGANHPEPSGTAIISNLQNGWVTGPAQVNFTASAASYSPSSNNPFPIAPYNGFTPAPVYSITYGLSPASNPLPDTTLPIATDQSVYPATSAQGFGNPLCSSGAPNYFAPAPVSVTPSSDGIYYLHYYTTACDLTEGLIFQPSNLTSPTVNWASFPYVTFGYESTAPTFSFAITGIDVFGTNTPATPTASGWYNTDLTDQWKVTDESWAAGATGSGFGTPPPGSIQGSQTESVATSTSVGAGNVNSTAYTSAPKACDIAGYCVSGAPGGPYMIDEQPPTVTVTAGTSKVGGPAITVTATCSDGVGSGIPSGGCVISGTPANYVPNVPACTTPGESVTCGGTIPTSTPESGTISVNATDNAGNMAMNSTSYTVNPNVWTISPSPYSFPELSVGQSASQQFSVYNPGPNSTAITVTIPPNPAGDTDDFKITSNGCGEPLAGGAFCYVTVTFAADSDDPGLPNGNYASLTVESGKTILVQALMTERVVDPTVSVSQTVYPFGSQTTGKPITELVTTLTNQGPTTLLFGSIDKSGSAFKRATGAGTNCTSYGTLAPGASCLIYMTFTPSKKGTTYFGTVTIHDNATKAPQVISLSGTGD